MKKTIEEVARKAVELSEHLDAKEQAMFIAGFQTCFQWQSEQMYSYEEVLMIIQECKLYLGAGDLMDEKQWFTQFKTQ